MKFIVMVREVHIQMVEVEAASDPGWQRQSNRPLARTRIASYPRDIRGST